METAASKIHTCSICANLDYDTICSICADDTRIDVIAIVETVAELWAIERSGIFQGKYHVLGNSSNSYVGKSYADLRLPELLKRCQVDQVKEIIIATNSTLDGQTIAYFITEYFKDHSISISRLASGIPMGGELDYLDDGTLSAAFERRSPFE